MIRILSAIGGIAVAIAAVLLIIAGVALGYNLARTYEATYSSQLAISGARWIPPQEWLGMLLGGLAGLLVAGVILGTMATLYEIRDSLHDIRDGMRLGARMDADTRHAAARTRMEPRIEQPDRPVR